MTASDFWESVKRNDGTGRFDCATSWSYAMVRILFAFAEAYHDSELRDARQKAGKQE